MNKISKEVEAMTANDKNIRFVTDDEILTITNQEKRKIFLSNYSEWGVWLDIPQIDVKVYKLIIPDNRVIFITEYYHHKVKLNYNIGPTVTYRCSKDEYGYNAGDDSLTTAMEYLKIAKEVVFKERRKKSE